MKKFVYFLVLLLLIAVIGGLLSSYNFRPVPNVLTGYVVDADSQKPLANARVAAAVRSKSAGSIGFHGSLRPWWRDEATTSTNGRFEIDFSNHIDMVGKYQLEHLSLNNLLIEKEGYESLSIKYKGTNETFNLKKSTVTEPAVK